MPFLLPAGAAGAPPAAAVAPPAKADAAAAAPDIDGVVRDVSGKPVSGVTVRWRVFHENKLETALTTTADAQGRFHFAGASAWAKADTARIGLNANEKMVKQQAKLGQVFVEAAGFGVQGQFVSTSPIPQIPRMASPANVTFTLQPGTDLHVRFVDANNRPLEGVAVRVAYVIKDQTAFDLSGSNDDSPWAQKTAADGSVVLKELPQGARCMLQVQDERFAQIDYKNGSIALASAARTDAPPITLVPGAAIDGTVIYGPSKKPAANVQVFVAGGTDETQVRQAVKTDEAGHFKIAQLPAAEYRLSATLTPPLSQDWASETVTCTVPEGGRKTGVDIALIKGALITGKVSYVGTHKPAAGVPVSIGHVQGNALGNDVSATTDAGGNFQARVVPGFISVYAQISSGGVRPEEITVVDGQTTAVSLEIPVPIPPLMVKGIVVDGAGKPVPNADIQVATLNWNMPPPCRSGDDGRFTVSLNDTSMVFLRARLGDRVTRGETLALNGDDVTLTLADGVTGSAAGAVVDSDGRPVSGATVTPIQWSMRSGENLPPVTTDAVGGYRFTGLLPGVRYTFQVEMKGYGRASVDNVVLQPGGSFTAQNIVLPEANSFVAGHVMDSHGSLLVGATVTWNDDRSVQTTTDKHGAFRLQGVTPGKVVLEVRKDDEWTNMQVDAGKDGVVIRTYSQSAQAQQMAAQPKPEDSVGKQAPELAVSHWVNVSPVTMEDLRGKFVVFDCWGCCADSLFETQRIVQQLGARGVVGIGLNVSGSSLKEVQEHVAQEHLTLPVAIDNSTARGLGTGGFEAYALVDRAGRIAYSGWDFQQLLQTLGQKLAEEQAAAK